MRRFAAGCLVSLAVALSWASPAHADGSSDVDKGRNAYLARQYDEADARFRAMLDPKTGTVKEKSLISEALMLWGAVKVAQKKNEEATKLFEELITNEPQFEPDPLRFPTEVLDVFSDARHRIREQLSAAARERARLEAIRKVREEQERKRAAERLARLERLAGEETVREPRNRFVAFIPFGAGQFQNGDKTLGWGFLTAQTVFIAVGTAVVPFAMAERSAMNEAYEPAFREDATRTAETHRQNALRLQLVNLVAYGAFAITALAGIVQANIAYVPERVRVQKRDPKELDPTFSPNAPPAAKTNGPALPSPSASSQRIPQQESSWRLAPSVTPVPSGLAAGLEGRW